MTTLDARFPRSARVAHACGFRPHLRARPPPGDRPCWPALACRDDARRGWVWPCRARSIRAPSAATGSSACPARDLPPAPRRNSPPATTSLSRAAGARGHARTARTRFLDLLRRLGALPGALPRDCPRPAQCRPPPGDPLASPSPAPPRLACADPARRLSLPAPMNQTRVFLIFAWLMVATLLWMEWGKEQAGARHAGRPRRRHRPRTCRSAGAPPMPPCRARRRAPARHATAPTCRRTRRDRQRPRRSPSPPTCCA